MKKFLVFYELSDYHSSIMQHKIISIDSATQTNSNSITEDDFNKIIAYLESVNRQHSVVLTAAPVLLELSN